MLVTPRESAWRARWQLWTTQSRFGRNFWVVARANVLAQALPLLVAPLLTRLYSPDSFGVLVLFTSVLGIGLAFGTARFEWSIPNARSQTMAVALLTWGALTLLACTALVWVVDIVTSPWSALPGSALAVTGWLLPLALMGAGLQQLLQAWHVRGADLAAVGRAKIGQSIANVVVSLAGAGWGGIGLLAGSLAGSWVGLGTLWRRAHGLRSGWRRMRRVHLNLAWAHFRKEALWSTTAAVLNTISFAVTPLLLARHYGAADVGYYALMQRVALGPVVMLGSAISQSFWVEAARLVRTDPAALESLFRRSSRRLLGLSLPLALVALAGPLYIGPLFGSAQWGDAGWVVAASVPMLIGQAVVSPLSHLIVHRRQRWQALWDVLRILLLVLTIEILGQQQVAFALAVFAVSLVMGVTYVALYVLNLRAIALCQRGLA